MTQSFMPRAKGQKAMEKAMVVMVLLLLFGLSQASLDCKIDKECRRDVCIFQQCKPRSISGGTCETNAHCINSANVCINKVCTLPSPPGGPCDLNDNGDCGTPNYICLDKSCTYDLSVLQWEGNKAMSMKRTSAATVSVDGFLYVLGGQLFSTSENVLGSSVEMYNPANNSWVSKADMPVATWRHSAVVVGTDIFLVGGADVNENGQTHFYRYDTVNNVWSPQSSLSQLPTGLQSTAVTVVGTTIFTFGGQTGENVATAQVLIYSFNTASPSSGWKTLPSLFFQLTRASAVSVDTSIYITGGTNNQNTFQTNILKFDSTNSVISLPNIPITTTRVSHSSFFDPSTNKIYLVGGVTIENKAKTVETLDLTNPTSWKSEPSAALYLSTTASPGAFIGSRFYMTASYGLSSSTASSLLHVLDVPTLKWIPFAPSPDPTLLSVSGKIGSYIITAGGLNQDSEGSIMTTKYDIPSNSWTPIPSTLDPARIQPTSAVVGSDLYAIGGYSASDTAVLREKQNIWTIIAPMKGPRYVPCAASQGTKIYAYGGLSEANQVVDSMEIYETDIQQQFFDTWRDVTDSSKTSGNSPTPLAYCAAVSTGTKILIFGGFNQTPGFVFSTSIQVFDIQTEKWDASIPTTLTPRYAPSATVLNGFVIISGGGTSTSGDVATVEAYQISTGKVTVLPDMPSSRYGHGSVTDGDSVIVFGGYNGNLFAPVERLRIIPSA